MNNNQQKEIFQGVWPAMFTPVFDNGDLNVKELEKLIELLIEQDVDGLYLLGSTGQGFLFNEKQRREITEIALQINNNRLPVMVQVGALNTDESVRLAKHAEQCGVQAVFAVGPIFFFSAPGEGLGHHRQKASSFEIPFFPSQIWKIGMNKEMIQQLKKIKNMRGMKLTTLNLVEISNIHNDVGPGWKLFSGADELLCHAALCGTAGAIGSTYNLIGYACKDIRQKFLAGQVTTGIAFMLRLQKLIEQVLPCIWTFFNRAMLLKHGINIGRPKPPLLFPDLAWSDEEILSVVEELESFSINNIPA